MNKKKYSARGKDKCCPKIIVYLLCNAVRMIDFQFTKLRCINFLMSVATTDMVTNGLGLIKVDTIGVRLK